MSSCSFTQHGEGAVRCEDCGRVVFTDNPPEQVFAPCGKKWKPPGVGTLLKKELEWFGFRPNGKCACDVRAAEMDRRGVKWCKQNRGTILGWLSTEAEALGIRWTPAVALGASAALSAAILAATVSGAKQ